MGILADMHDGDKKEIRISGDSMIITPPSAYHQQWKVEATLDRTTCSAMIDFNVPGKPSPPPVKLEALIVSSVPDESEKVVVEFTDPSGTLAKSSFPLNTWVTLSDDDHTAHAPIFL